MCIRDRLPSYTSDIIDVGIQNSGVEHIVPEKLTKSEFETAQFIMTDDETDVWKGLYEADGEFYKLKDKSEKELDEADEKLTLPLIMNYQMSTLEVSSFKKTIASQMGKKESELENMSVEPVSYTHLDVYKRQVFEIDCASEESVEAKMLQNNNICGLLACDFRYEDNRTYIYYDTTDKMAVSDIMKEGKMTYDILKEIYTAIAEILKSCQKYLISADSVLLNKDLIFGNRKYKNLKFCVLPDVYKRQAHVCCCTDYGRICCKE